MTQIFTRIFRLKLMVIALFLFCDFAIVSKVRKNQKSAQGTAYSSYGATIDYGQLQKVDFIEDGVHKTYYCDPAKNVVYNPYVNCYIVFNGGCQNEANHTSSANSADVEVVYVGPLPADFNQKILLAQQNGAISNGMEVNGASFQSRQPVQVVIPADYSRAHIRQQVGIPVKEMEAIMQGSMTSSYELLSTKPSRANVEIPIWGAKRSSKPGGVDINNDIRGHRAFYEIQRQRAIAQQEANFKVYCDNLVEAEDLSQLKELKEELQKGKASLWFWELLSDRANSLYTRLPIVNEDLETVSNLQALRTIPYDEACKLFSQLEEKMRADHDKLDQKNCSSCTKCNNERKKIDGIYNRAKDIIKARKEMQNKLIAEANRAILVRQAVIEKQEQERLAAIAQQERLAREGELEKIEKERLAEQERLAREVEIERVEKERIAQQERSAKEVALEREIEQAEQANREQIRLAELVRQEKLAWQAELEKIEKERFAEQERLAILAEQEKVAREVELERVEKERLAEQERLAREAALKREYEQAQQARRDHEKAELARQERLVRDAELEQLEKEWLAKQEIQAALAQQERLIGDAGLKKKHEIEAARWEKERLDLLSRQKKRDSLEASWREKLGGGGKDAQRYQNRIDALNEVGGPVAPVSLSEHAYAMLEDFDLDQETFKPFFDHAIQQVLENEFVTIANDVAPLYGQYRYYAPVHELHKLMIESVNIGRQYNELGMVEAACRIADFCFSTLRVTNDILDGIGDGVIQGAVNTGTKLAHVVQALKGAIIDPTQAVHDLDHAIKVVGTGLAAVGKGLVEVVHFLAKVHDDMEAGRFKSASERWAPVRASVKDAWSSLSQKCCQLSAYEASRGLVSFSTEFVLDILLQKKICKVGGQFLTFANKQVRKVVVVERMLTATERLHALSKAKIAKTVEQLGAFSKKKIAQLTPRILTDEWPLLSSIEQVSGEAYESMRTLEQLHLQNINRSPGRTSVVARAASAGEPVETVAATVAERAPVANIAPAQTGALIEKTIGVPQGSVGGAAKTAGGEVLEVSKITRIGQGSAVGVEAAQVDASASKITSVIGGAVCDKTLTWEMVEGIWVESEEFVQMNEQIKALIKKGVTDTQVGLLEHTSALADTNKLLKAIEKAEILHDEIRCNVAKYIDIISNNTGIQKSTIEKIMKHVFVNEHPLRLGVKVFDSELNMVAAFKRLIEGNIVEADLLLLQHELSEALIMNKFSNVTYDCAHGFVNKKYNWDKYLMNQTKGCL